MKKTILSACMAVAITPVAANAAFFAANSTYDVTVRASGSCFMFVAPGNCIDTIGQNLAVDGSFTLTTDASGSAFSVGNYSGLDFTGIGGLGTVFTIGNVNGFGMVGAAGEIDLNFSGRLANFLFHPYAGDVTWIVEGIGIGAAGGYSVFTSGTDSNLDTGNGAGTDTGVNLALVSDAAGIGTWEGTIVTMGNFDAALGAAFVGANFSERLNISITGAIPSAVPVPAAIWLMGSGLLGLIGIARRR